MRNARLFCRFSLFFSLRHCSFRAAPLHNRRLTPGTLPGRTVFYLLWHGTPSGEIRKNNSAVRAVGRPAVCFGARLLARFRHE